MSTALFTDGQPGSRSTLWQALQDIQTNGQEILDDLDATRQTTLLAFEQGLAALKGRRQRVNRLLSPDMAGRFAVSDLLDIDQAQTSATVRADSEAVSLKQRKNTPAVVIDSQAFAATSGSVQSFGNLYQVYCPDGSIPTGTFDIRFSTSVLISLLVFDLVLTPSTPTIQIQVSADGVYYVDATQITRNGPRVSAYFPTLEIRFLRIAITPSLPDNIGGHTFTFGMQGFFPYLVAFHLESQLATKGVTIFPQSPSLQVDYVQQPGIKTFVSLDSGATFAAVTPGTTLPVPGATAVLGDNTALVDSYGSLYWKDQTGSFVGVLPAGVYRHSLRIFDSSGNPVSVVPGLDPTTAAALAVPVVCWWNNNLYAPSLLSTTGYTVSYAFGPASLTAYLRVQLVSRDRSQTPVFSGLTLLNS